MRASGARQYRKKPVVIEAVQFDLSDWESWIGLIQDPGDSRVTIQFPEPDEPGLYLEIETLEGTMRAQNLDWIIEGVDGELYPCKPAIFARTYEEEAA